MNKKYLGVYENDEIFKKANKKKNMGEKDLILRLGTSHNIVFPLYKYGGATTLKVLTLQNNFITLALFGISQEIIKKVAAEIYLLKKPEPYKGKGIRYDGEKFFSKEKTKQKKN